MPANATPNVRSSLGSTVNISNLTRPSRSSGQSSRRRERRCNDQDPGACRWRGSVNTSVVSLAPRCLHEEVSPWIQCSSSDDGEATPSRCMCRKPQYIDRGDHETTTGSRNGRTLSRNSSNKVLGCQHDHQGSPPPWSLGDFDRQRTLALHLWMALWISWSSTGIQRACRTEVQAMF